MTEPAQTNVITNDIETQDPNSSMPTLFRHMKRESWGLGILQSVMDDRIQMQFQDGRNRSFKKGYYHLLDAVDRPMNIAAGIVDALQSMMPEDDRPELNRRILPPSMNEQVEYLRELFPGGFQDEGYAEHHRGDGRKRPLKRHRDALVARAEKHLTRKILQGDPTEAHKNACKVLTVTGLVGAKERKLFKGIDEAHHEPVMSALRALLYGKSNLIQRMDAYVRALENAMEETPTWELATVFLGAVHPKEHVVVRARVLSLQAEWMAPGLLVSDRPMGLLYERLVTMTKGVHDLLTEAGLEPRDYLDLHDFMWVTLKPAGQKRIMQMRQRRELMNPAEPMATAETEAA
ncbi:MAG: hypothetical protein CMN30_04730 [Sandaracinus sp.]|nr:hypothetical protein [Sandaracinus sp.]